MKKLILLFIIFPAFEFGQENLKMSALDFITGYFKLFEEKKWDNIYECSEDLFMYKHAVFYTVIFFR